MPKRFALTLIIAALVSSVGTTRVALAQYQRGGQYDGCVTRQANSALYNGCSQSLRITLCTRSEVDTIWQTGCQKNTIGPNSSQSDEGVIYDKWRSMIYACAVGYHAVLVSGVDIETQSALAVQGVPFKCAPGN